MNAMTSVTSAAQSAAQTLYKQKLLQVANSGEPFAEIVTITPALAAVMLEGNEGNRNIKPSKLDQLKRDIKEGRFALNGETIIIARDGHLNDGQHRLTAIVETGISVKSLVMFGADPLTKTTIDLGAARSGGDIFAIDAVKNAATVSSLMKMIVSYETVMSGPTAPAGQIVLGSSGRVSVPEARERYQSAKEHDRRLIDDAASYGNSKSKDLRGLMTPTQAAFCIWLLGKYDQAEITAMLEKIRTQLNWSPNDPAYATYHNLKRINHRKHTNNDIIEAVVRGWNNTRRGKQVRRSIQLQGVIPIPNR